MIKGLEGIQMERRGWIQDRVEAGWVDSLQCWPGRVLRELGMEGGYGLVRSHGREQLRSLSPAPGLFPAPGLSPARPSGNTYQHLGRASTEGGGSGSRLK